jgi:enoyl-[acyl-carrier-protein] reductase (NADH)
MVEVLFLLLGATLAFVYMQYEQKKDLEKRVKTLELDFLSTCDQLKDIERNVFQEVNSQVHSLKAEMWQHKQEHESHLRELEIKKLLKD